jgi:hypothetical protein
MAVATELSIGRLALLAGLSFLFGLAFERSIGTATRRARGA